MNNGPWMETVSHKRFYFLKPELSEISIGDIAVHLSHEPRFGGATLGQYCVAEHSIHHASLVRGNAKLKLRGLLHDAHEAYAKDITRPMKLALNSLAGFDIVRALVAPIDAAIEKALGVDLTSVEDGRETEIKRCDNILLDVESRAVMYSMQKDWVPFGIAEGDRMHTAHFDDLRLPYLAPYRGHLSYSDFCSDKFIAVYESLRQQVRHEE